MHGKSKINIWYLSFITKDIFILKLLICETLFIKCSKRLLVWMVNVVRDFKLKNCSPVFYEGPCVTAFTYRCKVFQGTAFWSPFRARTARKLSSSETSLCREEAGRLVREEKKNVRGKIWREKRTRAVFSPLPIVPGAFYFLVIAIFYWNTKRELCGGERCLKQRTSINKMHF